MTENEAAPESAAPAPAPAGRPSRVAVLALIAVLLAAGVAALAWLDTRSRIGATQEELARRLRDTPLFVPHARVARIAREMGFSAVEVAGPGDAQMLARLLAYFGGAK